MHRGVLPSAGQQSARGREWGLTGGFEELQTARRLPPSGVRHSAQRGGGSSPDEESWRGHVHEHNARTYLGKWIGASRHCRAPRTASGPCVLDIHRALAALCVGSAGGGHRGHPEQDVLRVSTWASWWSFSRFRNSMSGSHAGRLTCSCRLSVSWRESRHESGTDSVSSLRKHTSPIQQRQGAPDREREDTQDKTEPEHS